MLFLKSNETTRQQPSPNWSTQSPNLKLLLHPIPRVLSSSALLSASAAAAAPIPLLYPPSLPSTASLAFYSFRQIFSPIYRQASSIMLTCGDNMQGGKFQEALADAESAIAKLSKDEHYRRSITHLLLIVCANTTTASVKEVSTVAKQLKVCAAYKMATLLLLEIEKLNKQLQSSGSSVSFSLTRAALIFFCSLPFSIRVNGHKAANSHIGETARLSSSNSPACHHLPTDGHIEEP